MAKFVYIFTGGQMADTPAAQEEAMQAWGAWFETLGDAVADIGNPFSTSATVSTNGVASGAAGAASGYSIVTADSIDGAAALAKGCPILTGGGTVEVYEAVPM
jgi:hypothetical protein